MIRHIVLWKLDESYSTEEKTTIKTELRNKLLGLKNLVPELKEIAVCFNEEKANSTNFDVMLESEFTSLDDLQAYVVHPEHVKVGNYLKTLNVQRAAIDFSC